MTVLDKIAASGKIFVGVIGLISTFFTVIDLMIFLSDPYFKISNYVGKDWWLRIAWSLFMNMCLLSLFVLQHSLMAFKNVKNMFNSIHIGDLQRTIYVICTCGVLQLLIKNWSVIPDIYVWKLNVNSTFIWWMYFVAHLFSWIIIYTGTISVDVNELLGVKQIYYSIRHLPSPNCYKSSELQRLHNHIRHPSFLAFLIILWMVPIMTLDKFLLASILSVYMYLAWIPDERDYRYQLSQYIRKFHELNYLN